MHRCAHALLFSRESASGALIFARDMLATGTTYGAQEGRKRARNATGADSGIRTHDLRITSAPLYH